MTVTADPEAPGTPGGRAGTATSPGMRTAVVCSVVAAAWLVPIAVEAVRADLLLPILMLLATAAVLTAGVTLLDRLVIAACVLAGLLLVEGLLFSYWPWGIGAVPVSGVTFTVLSVVGLLRYFTSGRLGRIPLKVRSSDFIVLAAPVAMWVLLRKPLQGKNFIQSLPYTAASHDSFNHYSLFDAIRHIGGYQFLKPAAARPYVDQMYVYPPGSHYLYALLDVFRLSSANPGDAPPEFLRYYQYQAMSLCLLALGVTWSARRIAGPYATGWHRVLVCATVAGFAVFGQLSALFWDGYTAEALGLGLLAVSVAMAARPPRDVREQIIVSAALIIALGFVYPLFLVVLFPVLVAAMRTSRGRLQRHAVLTNTAALITMGAVLLPVAEGWRYPSARALLSSGGAFAPFSRPLSVVLALIALSAFLTRAGKRAPSWQMATTAVASACAFAVTAEIVGKIRKGAPQYYSSKLVAAALVLSLCGFGAITLFLKPVRIATRLTQSRAGKLLPGVVAAVAALALTHGLPSEGDPRAGSMTAEDVSQTIAWAEGYLRLHRSQPLVDYARVAPLADGVPTILVTAEPQESRQATMFLADLNHDLGTIDADALDSTAHVAGREPGVDKDFDTSCALLDNLSPQSREAALADPAAARAFDVVQKWIRSRPAGLRMAVTGATFASLLADFASENPDRRLDVVFVPAG